MRYERRIKIEWGPFLQWFQMQDNRELLKLPGKGANMNIIEHVFAQMINTWDIEIERNTIDLIPYVRR